MKTETSAEANRLYWNSDKSVGDIADQLDISRRALYEALQPAEAGIPCPACGTQMQYPNRSARDAKQPLCFSCATSSPQEPIATEPEAWTWSPGASGQSTDHGRHRTDLGERARLLGGAALLGAVIGAVATHLLLGRD